jgi:hypothetical protein
MNKESIFKTCKEVKKTVWVHVVTTFTVGLALVIFVVESKTMTLGSRILIGIVLLSALIDCVIALVRARMYKRVDALNEEITKSEQRVKMMDLTVKAEGLPRDKHGQA